MQLNLPILHKVTNAKNILIAGIGGGFDVFMGLPLYFTLQEMGKKVHLANYSFCDFDLINHVSETEVLLPQRLMGTKGPVSRVVPYFPEGYLAQWFKEVRGEEVTVWMFAKTGVTTLLECYRCLVDRLGIDAIILVDGGVDSLMRGDEPQPGTFLEDSISLAAVESLGVPTKLLAVLGFGTEIEDALTHYCALENIAALAKQDAFLGTCSLTPQMPAFQEYEQASRYVWEQPFHQKSRIGMRVVPAVHGEFGNYHMYEDDDESQVYVLISPLLSMYWFFDAVAVSQRSLVTSAIRHTTTTREALAICGDIRRNVPIRSARKLPY
jgi:hypothetical protein